MNTTNEANSKGILGLYKAEWLAGSKLFDFFTEPSYFQELKTTRPCVLIGGRGTGKTTVLRGLSYQGQYALNKNNTHLIKQWKFYGLYYRVNTNRVTAFTGDELSEEQWRKYFSHYINLSFCLLILEFANWYEINTKEKIVINQQLWTNALTTLHLRDVNISTITELIEEIELLLLEFEAAINTIIDCPINNLTMLSAPIDALSKAILNSPQLEGKQFFFLIDEFENFENYQQKILNTIVKHTTHNYTFKIGIRELGWRERATLNSNEQLTSPADYARIDIAEIFNSTRNPNRFGKFAQNIIETRLSYELNFNTSNTIKIQDFLPDLSELDEAVLLLGDNALELQNELKNSVSDKEIKEKINTIELGHMYFIKYWSEVEHTNLKDNILDWLNNNSNWSNRINNHFHASLFTIRKNKSGIRKYYSGWNTYLKLANGNIRYLLELVNAAFLLYKEAVDSDSSKIEKTEKTIPISHEIQTQAAINIGSKNLSELEGLSVNGAKLKKLLLGLGRVFQVFAGNPSGHAPEVNQFHIRDNIINKQVDTILNQAVMHLALIRQSGNKLGTPTDTKDYDYMIHPIFSPYFVFSYRKKRKFLISQGTFIKLIDNTKEAITELLDNNNRENLENTLPDQLQLFDSYYANN